MLTFINRGEIDMLAAIPLAIALSCVTPSGWTARADFHGSGVWSVVETRGAARIEQIVRPALYWSRREAIEELARRCAENGGLVS